MAFVHAPLDEDTLGPLVRKLLAPDGPGPMRKMVAQGLAPLPPRDLVVALYQLWASNDPELGETAGRTAAALPDHVMDGALADPGLPPGVLDFLGRKSLDEAARLEKIVQHPQVHDETLAALARVAPDPVCEVLADNQVRWLAHPKIVESLYHNPNCRMSTVHRVLELAVREGIELRLPNLEEIRQAMEEDEGPAPERDEIFRAAAGGVAQAQERRLADLSEAPPDAELEPSEPSADAESALEDLDDLLGEEAGAGDLPLVPEEGGEAGDGGAAGQDAAAEPGAGRRSAGAGRRLDAVTFSKLRPMEKIRLALLGDTFERSLAIRDANRVVALAAIKSPRVKENEVVHYSANRTLPHDVIRYIAGRRDWLKLYAVKLNLVMNPKTPMAVAMTLLGHLQPQDLRKVAQSRNIPSALAAAAKRRLGRRR